jgi:histidyl-tRNA synthetase
MNGQAVRRLASLHGTVIRFILMKYSAPPYMHDVLPYPPEKDSWLHTSRWRALERIFRETCRLFGYREIRTPVMEATELFTRSIGDGTDIVSKEMFTFTDRGGRSMTLRPEGTAPVVRALIENGLIADGTVLKLYYIATIYRYEHGQRGRYREHQQTGAEVIGSGDPAVDAEVISLAIEFFRRLGITDAELRLNSVGCPACRPEHLKALIAYAEPRLEQMSPDNRRRFQENPLRMLDSKDPRDHAALADCPRLADYLCAECAEHFAALQRYLADLDIRATLDANLVRGFDYYTKTAFEVISPQLGAQNVIGGGGRYDGLVEDCGGRPTPGIGFGIGTERCLMVLDQIGHALPLEDETPLVFVAVLGDEARRRAVRLVRDLRAQGIAADTDYLGRSLKAQMRAASRLGARSVAILGNDELERAVTSLKDMSTGTQVDVRLDDLADMLQRFGEERPTPSPFAGETTAGAGTTPAAQPDRRGDQ